MKIYLRTQWGEHTRNLPYTWKEKRWTRNQGRSTIITWSSGWALSTVSASGSVFVRFTKLNGNCRRCLSPTRSATVPLVLAPAAVLCNDQCCGSVGHDTTWDVNAVMQTASSWVVFSSIDWPWPLLFGDMAVDESNTAPAQCWLVLVADWQKLGILSLEQRFSTYDTRVICDTLTKKLWFFTFIFNFLCDTLDPII